jgi:type II secretory pathway pseudopilin PulG
MIKKIFNLNLKKAYPAKLQRSGGFTVLESIVAIMVLSLSISGVFSAVQTGLSQASIAKDEVKAFYLAQEAVEIIRNKRDTNQLARINVGTGNWLAGIAQNNTDPCWFGKTCRVDAKSFNLVDCSTDPGGVCPVLKQNSSTFLYNYDLVNPATNPATNFKREIQIEQVIGNSDEIAVTVRISWTTKGFVKSFMVKTHLLNWI